MARRLTTAAGTVAATAGFAAALVSLALPWASFRLSAEGVGSDAADHSGDLAVYQLGLGHWYVAALLAVLALLALAVSTDGLAARAAGTAAVLIAPAWMFLVYVQLTGSDVAARNDTVRAMGAYLSIDVSPGPGIGFGKVALPLLTAGVVLLSVRRPRSADRRRPAMMAG